MIAKKRSFLLPFRTGNRYNMIRQMTVTKRSFTTIRNTLPGLSLLADYVRKYFVMWQTYSQLQLWSSFSGSRCPISTSNKMHFIIIYYIKHLAGYSPSNFPAVRQRQQKKLPWNEQNNQDGISVRNTFLSWLSTELTGSTRNMVRKSWLIWSRPTTLPSKRLTKSCRIRDEGWRQRWFG